MRNGVGLNPEANASLSVGKKRKTEGNWGERGKKREKKMEEEGENGKYGRHNHITSHHLVITFCVDVLVC
jgi:hypothetical protein